MLEGFLRWHGNREIGEVTPEDVRAFMAHEEERGLAPSTIARARATLSSLYNWLCDPEVGLAEQNPVRAVKAPKLPKLKPKALRQGEVERAARRTSPADNRRL